MEGIGGETNKLKSKIYQVPIRDKFGQVHLIESYGIDTISTPNKLPEIDSYVKLCERFDVSPWAVQRPRTIDLLISMRDNHLLADTKLKTIGKMSLYEGLLGKVFGGLDPKLKFRQNPSKMSFRSQVSVKTQGAAVNPPSISQTHAAKTNREQDSIEVKNSPSNIEEGPRCQVLKLLHGAEVGFTNMVKKFLPSVEMEEGIKDETESPVSKIESKLSENIQPVSRTEFKLSETEKDDVMKHLKVKTYSPSATSATYSSNIKIENSPSSIERCGNLEIKSTACVPRLMGRRPLISGIKEVPEFRRFLINLEQRRLRDDFEMT